MHSTSEKALATIPKLTSLGSILSSIALAYIIIINPNEKNKSTPYHRLMLGMTTCDFLASTAWFFTTWPIPKDTGIYGAVGNQQVCAAQGFFAQVSLAAVMYTGSLAVYYVLVIVKNWTDARIAKIEPYLHAWSITWGLGTSFAGLAMNMFNPVGWDCWIGPMPMGCTESYRIKDDTDLENIIRCERGDNASLFAWFFFYMPLWLVIIFITASMIWIYKFIWDLEKRMVAYSFRPTNSSQCSRKFAKRAILYVGACYVTWFFPTILQVTLAISGTAHYWALLPTAILIPIQGVLNLRIYLMPDVETFLRNCDENKKPFLPLLKVLLIELGILEYNTTTRDITAARN